MSFKISAPAAAASRITSGLLVSTDTISPSRASVFTTGITRASSSSSETSAAPGRVDSPPTSMMSAPSAASFLPQATAASVVACSPPSEKESGVTFTIPMMRGRVRSSVRVLSFQATAAFEFCIFSCPFTEKGRKAHGTPSFCRGLRAPSSHPSYAAGGCEPLSCADAAAATAAGAAGCAAPAGCETFGSRGGLPAMMSSI